MFGALTFENGWSRDQSRPYVLGCGLYRYSAHQVSFACIGVGLFFIYSRSLLVSSETCAVCTDILHISGVAKRLTLCKGNYQEFENRRAELQATYEKSFEHNINI